MIKSVRLAGPIRKGGDGRYWRFLEFLVLKENDGRYLKILEFLKRRFFFFFCLLGKKSKLMLSDRMYHVCTQLSFEVGHSFYAGKRDPPFKLGG